MQQGRWNTSASVLYESAQVHWNHVQVLTLSPVSILSSDMAYSFSVTTFTKCQSSRSKLTHPQISQFLMGKYVCPSGFSKSSHIPSRHFHRFSRLHHGTCWHFTVLILMSSSVLAVVSTVLRQQPLSQYCFTCIETMAVIFSLINSKTSWKCTGGIRSV